MAALNFPPSPSANQIYTANGKSWRFDGTSWKTYYILNVQGGGTGNTSYNLVDVKTVSEFFEYRILWSTRY